MENLHPDVRMYRVNWVCVLLFFPLGDLSMPPNMDFSSLNIEQLVAVEGQERQNVEARINMLRTVHALLDAAIVQLNQYTQMVNAQR